MTERWERELAKLRSVEPDDDVVRRRVASSQRMDGVPPRRGSRLAAGVVAGLVAVAAIALVWSILPRASERVGGSTTLPVLTVSFHDSEIVPEGPDARRRSVDTIVAYGDAVEESSTTTVSLDTHIDWASADDLQPFVPGPTVGSSIDFRADGDDPRVLIGRPDDWPNVDAFTPVDQLPDVPGEYVLLCTARYPEGFARLALRVDIVEPSVLQLVLDAGAPKPTAAAYVDGRSTGALLSSYSYSEGDFGLVGVPRKPEFGADAWLPVPIGSPIVLADQPTSAKAGLFPDYEAFDPKEPLPFDLRFGDALVGVEPGKWLLAVEATWVHPSPGTGDALSSERALFFFPIEAVTEAETIEDPLSPSPSPPPTSEGSVTIDIRRSGEETSASRAFARFGGQEVRMCPDAWTLVNPDGTTESGTFDCQQEGTLTAPPATPIVVAGDFASVEATAWGAASGDRTRYVDEVPPMEPGSVAYYRWAVTWEDGSSASFRLELTIAGEAETTEPTP